MTAGSCLREETRACFFVFQVASRTAARFFSPTNAAGRALGDGREKQGPERAKKLARECDCVRHLALSSAVLSPACGRYLNRKLPPLFSDSTRTREPWQATRDL